MKKSTIDRLSKQVAKKFPEMDGVRPVVREQKAPSSGDEQYLLTYKGFNSLPNGKKMKRIVRVVADERGQVLKMST